MTPVLLLTEPGSQHRISEDFLSPEARSFTIELQPGQNVVKLKIQDWNNNMNVEVSVY